MADGDDFDDMPVLRARDDDVGENAVPGAAGYLQRTILSVCQPADPQGKGILSANDFWAKVVAPEVGLFLTTEELQAIVQAHMVDDQGNVSYTSVAERLSSDLAHLYQNREPHPSEWIYLAGQGVWVNKRTADSQAFVPGDVIAATQNPAAFAPPAAASVDNKGDDAETIARFEMELEMAHEDVLDAQAEVETLRKQLGELTSNGTGNDESLQKELDNLKEQLRKSNEEKEAAVQSQTKEQGEISAIINERDSLKSELRKEKATLKQEIEKLESEQRDTTNKMSTIQREAEKAKRDLNAANESIAELKKEVAKLKRRNTQSSAELSELAEFKEKFQKTQDDLIAARGQSEDRAKSLQNTRNQLKVAMEKVRTLEKEGEQVTELKQQLHEARELTMTTKSFLASKAKLLQLKTNEAMELQKQVDELEARDKKRAKIVETLLERATKMEYQGLPEPQEARMQAGRPVLSASHVAQPNTTTSRQPTKSRSPSNNTKKSSSRAGTNFPPIRRVSKVQQPSNYTPEPTLEVEDIAACHVRVGDRVLIKGRKNAAGVNTQLAGMVKFVGRVDAEVISYNLWVGLKMDEKVGEHDGIFKGKRYFRCPENHGLLVPLTDVISVINKKSGGTPRRVPAKIAV